MPEKTDEIIGEIFATAATDKAASLAAAPLSDVHASGRWEPGALDEVLRELEEQS